MWGRYSFLESWCTRFCCALPESVSQSCACPRALRLGSVVTPTQRACSTPRSAPPRAPTQATADPHLHRRHSDTIVAQSPWVGSRCVPFLALSSSGGRVLGSTLSQEGHGLTHLPDELLSLPGAPRECCLGCAVCLLSGADLRLQPSWQMSTLQDTRETWLAAGSLLAVWWRMPSRGLRLPLAFRLWMSPACLSASWQAGAGPQPASSPLRFAQSFVL